MVTLTTVLLLHSFSILAGSWSSRGTRYMQTEWEDGAWRDRMGEDGGGGGWGPRNRTLGFEKVFYINMPGWVF